MKTYNTYQEAKIANPDSVIVTCLSCFEPMENIASSQMYRWKECNPADYCMSEEDFIGGGYSYLNGDVIYSEISGLVLIIGIDVSIADMDWNDGFGHKRYILRAAALKTEHQQEMEELKPKRTRVEYELINKKSFFDLSDAFNLGEIFFDANGDKSKKSKVITELHLSQLFFRGGANIYRKVEVEIGEGSFVMDLLDDGTQDTPYVEFHGSSMTIDGAISIKEMRAITDALDDDGKFK